MDMYTIVKQAIRTGNYDLTRMTGKIETLWAADRLTDGEREELRELALAYLDPVRSRPDTLVMLEALAARVTALEQLHAPADPGEYPEWVKWDGLSTDYQPGAIVRHEGKLWQSVCQGQNTWEPGLLGTETLWNE